MQFDGPVWVKPPNETISSPKYEANFGPTFATCYSCHGKQVGLGDNEGGLRHPGIVRRTVRKTRRFRASHPDLLAEHAKGAAARGIRAIIAGAGGAAHLPGMLAAHTSVPVLGVPVQSKALSGMDSLLSIVQMPAGVPVATFAIGVAGAKNAALFAASLLAPEHPEIGAALNEFRDRQTRDVLAQDLD